MQVTYHKASYFQSEKNTSEDHLIDSEPLYPLEVVKHLLYLIGVTKDLEDVIVHYGVYVGTGRPVTITAPNTVWDKVWYGLARQIGDQIWENYGELNVVEREGSKYLVAYGRIIKTVHYLTQENSTLDMVKKGYAFLQVSGKTVYFEHNSLKI